VFSGEYYSPIRKETVKNIPASILKNMYITMARIRKVDEKIADFVAQKKIICPCHLYIGQEAVATGVCANLKKQDYVYSTHRSHGHYIAKGGDIKAMMAEIFGKETGCSRGNGGSMHLVAPELGFPGSSAIVAGTIPIAVGTALAFSIQGSENVSVAFFGDGAATEGVFYESLNFAALKKLPVVFVCENNFYSTHMHISAIQSNIEIYKKAEAFNMRAMRIDGNNVVDVYNTAREAVEDARAGRGPTLIECTTYRWRGHVGPNWDVEKSLRSQEEVDSWVNNCGMKRIEGLLLEMGIMSDSEKKEINEKIISEIEEAVRFVQASPFPSAEEYKENVFK